MIRTVALLAAIVACNAFAPAGRVAKSSMVMDLIGASPPVGFFDPLGLSKDKDEATMNFYRAAELKHGRVCMLASLGIIVQGYNAGVSIPNPAFTEGNAFKAVAKVFYGNPAALVQVEPHAIKIGRYLVILIHVIDSSSYFCH
jgi:Chlorophyll A-B binding protein